MSGGGGLWWGGKSSLLMNMQAVVGTLLETGKEGGPGLCNEHTRTWVGVWEMHVCVGVKMPQNWKNARTSLLKAWLHHRCKRIMRCGRCMCGSGGLLVKKEICLQIWHDYWAEEPAVKQILIHSVQLQIHVGPLQWITPHVGDSHFISSCVLAKTQSHTICTSQNESRKITVFI